MRWPGWYRVSVRKPLAVAAAVWGAGLVSLAFWFDKDIPPRAADVMEVLIYMCVGGYVGSSAYEACKGNGSGDANDTDVVTTDAIGFQVETDSGKDIDVLSKD
ncbi:hypothetical protein FACS1894204_05670 [Synergistales bacterium]|nr:hypothetical protein FACS1894204_05670 [Synergistales bacterium]